MLICPSCAHENPVGQKFCGECGTKLEASPIREERKVITALFCDLVGSTALGERLDAEDISRLLREYQQICRARIESHGGVIEKFIGDAVVGVFGVPLAHEDDPERAVRAALRITEDIGASELRIEVRIGINTGEALVRLDVDPRSGLGFATGDTMNTAARLEAAAPVMGVAVGALTHRASVDAIVYEELVPISAKGKAELVPTWRALHPIARVGTTERDRTPFLGRDLELSMLTKLFDRSRSRPVTEFVTIIAEPGLGKSRLVRELARHLDTLPEFVTWLEGRCLPYGDGISFWALGEIVKAQAGILETDDQAAIAAKLAAALVEPDEQTKRWMIDRLAPLVGLDTTTEPPQREEAFTAWRRFVEQLTTGGPTVLVAEDLHWADEGLIAFLEHLSERAAGLPLLLIATARPELEERHPSWPPGRRSTVLSLPPLEKEDVEAMIASTLAEAPPEITAIVVDRAGGSPLYAEQLAAMLRERALPIAGGALDETLIPESIQALIAARIDSLPPDAKQVLMHASVVGKTFWSGAVAALTEKEDLESGLAELVRREFCRPVYPSTMGGEREFSFWHALVREVAYTELTKAEKARMHAALARWIVEKTDRAMGEDAEIVVHHVDAALAFAPSAPELDTDELSELLVDALIASGESAMRTDAAAADRLLERALGLIDETSPRYLRAIGLRGLSLQTAGRPNDALPFLERAFEAARSAHDYDEAVLLTGTLTTVYSQTGRSQEASALQEELLQELGSEPSGAKAALLGGLSIDALVEGQTEKASTLVAEGYKICDALNLPPPAWLQRTSGMLRVVNGDLEGEREVREAARRVLEMGRPMGAAGALFNLSGELADWIGVSAFPIVEEAIRLCETRGAGDVTVLRVYRLLDLITQGRWDELDPASDLAREVREAGAFAVESVALLAIGYIELERAGTLTAASRLAELVPAWDTGFWTSSFGGAVLSRCPEPAVREVGLAVLQEQAGDGTQGSPPLFYARVQGAISAGALGLAKQLAPDPDAFRPPAPHADADAAVGAIAEAEGQWDEAAARYGPAVEAFEELGYFGLLPGPLVGYGRSLLHLGQKTEGLTKIEGARALCERLGANAWLAEIDEIVPAGS